MNKFGGNRDGFLKAVEEEIERAKSQRHLAQMGRETVDWDGYIKYLEGLVLEADLLMEFEEDEDDRS